MNLGNQPVDPTAGPLQALVGPEDPHVVPHEPADLVPVVRHDDGLVTVHGMAGTPGRDIGEPGREELFIAGNVCRGPVREDDRLEQRIARQAVGPVKPGARHFTDRIEPADVGAPLQIRDDPPASVVGRRNHGDRIGRHVDTEGEADPVDVGKTLLDEGRALVRDVEEYVFISCAFELSVDRPGDDIAGR